MRNFYFILYFLFFIPALKSFSQGDTSKKISNSLPVMMMNHMDTAVGKLNNTSLVNLGKKDSMIITSKELKTGVYSKTNDEITKLQKLSSSEKLKTDSAIQKLNEIPTKFVKQVNKKIETYSRQLSKKTEKTLSRLSKWENKIQRVLLKVNPEAASKLFGNNQETFASLLKKLKAGESISQNYKARYDRYRENLSSDLKYMENKETGLSTAMSTAASGASKKIVQLNSDVKNSEITEQFIKERKNRLIDESVKYIGKSKYLKRINKDAYYYAESLKNYKETFSDPKKTEEMASRILNNVPAFKKFADQNSSLSGLFASSSGSLTSLPAGASVPIVNGLASRSSLQQYVKSNIPSLANVNLTQALQNKIQAMPNELDRLKNAANEMGKSINKALPDFKPNNQKTKPFRKRLEFGTDLQFGKNTNFLPSTSDVAVKVGYKLNDKSSAGVGISYKLGMGNGWDHVKLSSEGLGYRTYLKWKFKKGLDVQGGSEWNYMLQFNKIKELQDKSAWQQSALLGLSKSYNIKKRLKGNIQALYDFLHDKHLPVTQPLVIRFGYGL